MAKINTDWDVNEFSDSCEKAGICKGTIFMSHPLTEEDYDKLLDVDMEFVSEVSFYTKHGKEVAFVRKKPNNSWISVKDRLPEDQVDVLAVKELKNGRRDLCIARCIREWECYCPATGEQRKMPYWICGGNNNIIYWMPLPEMPGGIV